MYTTGHFSLWSLCHYGKPIIWSETGPLGPNGCDDGATWRKQVWMNAFVGIAGFNFWAGAEPQFHGRWDDYKTVRDFIEGTPEVADFMLGDWEPHYANDDNPAHDAKQLEATYLSSMPLSSSPPASLLGYPGYKMVGCFSNMTDNYFTNRSPGDDSTFCFTQIPNTNLQEKINFGFPTVHGTIPLGIYNYKWHDTYANYFESNISGITGTTDFPFGPPHSCITSSCAGAFDYNPESPFIANWIFPWLPFMPQVNEPPTQTIETDIHIQEIDALAIDQRSVKEFDLLIFPNPVETTMRINCNDPAITKFLILDGKGKQLTSMDANLDLIIDVANYASGMYVIVGEDIIGTTKYVKRWVKK